jgi:cytoskeletal protein CcmA (bactofilin family)
LCNPNLSLIPKKEKFFESEEHSQTSTENNPIFIPSESYIEGYLKSIKSIILERSFTGTIFTSKKLLIERSASM